MRILVFFDLPVVSKEDRRSYQQFRKFLIQDGYDMLQFSVYCRIVNGEDAVNKHLKRLEKKVPAKGSIRFLQITERQYAAMRLLSGGRTLREKKLSTEQLLIF